MKILPGALISWLHAIFAFMIVAVKGSIDHSLESPTTLGVAQFIKLILPHYLVHKKGNINLLPSFSKSMNETFDSRNLFYCFCQMTGNNKTEKSAD